MSDYPWENIKQVKLTVQKAMDLAAIAAKHDFLLYVDDYYWLRLSYTGEDAKHSQKHHALVLLSEIDSETEEYLTQEMQRILLFR